MDQQRPHPMTTLRQLQRSNTCPVATELSPTLSALEEFGIGCISGTSGAVLSWFQFSGLSFWLYVVLTPTMLLDITEAYSLFALVSRSPRPTKAEYAAARDHAVARKRLARQMYGQGVILGSAGLEVLKSSSVSNLEEGTYQLHMVLYASLWLVWMVVCHLAHDSSTVHDKRQPKKQGSNRQTHNGTRRTSLTSLSSSSSSSSSSRSNRRNSRRSSKNLSLVVPIDLA